MYRMSANPPERVADRPITDTKGLMGSKTVWGVVIMLLAPYLQRWFGLDLSGETGVGVANDLPVLFGAFLAIYGRVKASGKIDDVF